MKNFILLLRFQLVVVIAVGQPLKKLVDIDDSTNIARAEVHRYTRALKRSTPPCSINQYFDEGEGRCLGVTGGGKVLYVNSTISCGINVLKPHCSNPRYYYICKRNKTILAQCAHRQHFEHRLQKCVHVDQNDFVSSTIQPDLNVFDSTQLPDCTKPGSFPVPGDCNLFYTCETNGHRMFQNFYRCPKDMAYDAETEMCSFSSTCEDTRSNATYCAPIIKEPQKIKEATNTESPIDVTTDSSNEEDQTSRETVPNDEDKEDTTMYDDNELASTVSYAQATSPEFEEFDDNLDVSSTTERASYASRSLNTGDSAAYSMKDENKSPLEGASSSTETGTLESLLETSTSMEAILNEMSSEIEENTEQSISQTEPSNVASESSTIDSSMSSSSTETEIQATTEIGESDLLESSTSKEFISSEQSGTSVTEDTESLISQTEPTNVASENSTVDPTTPSNTKTETKTSEEPLLESSTSKEFVSNERPSTTTIEKDTEQSTTESELTNVASAISTVDPSTFSSTEAEMETSEPLLETATSKDSVSSEQPNTTGLPEETQFNDKVTTEQLPIEVENDSEEIIPTTNKSSDKDINFELIGSSTLPNELLMSTESTTISDEGRTSEPTNLNADNEAVKPDVEDKMQSSIPQATEVSNTDEIENTSAIPTENTSNTLNNIFNNVASPSSTDATNSNTEAEISVTSEPVKFDETSTLNSMSSSEPTFSTTVSVNENKRGNTSLTDSRTTEISFFMKGRNMESTSPKNDIDNAENTDAGGSPPLLGSEDSNTNTLDQLDPQEHKLSTTPQLTTNDIQESISNSLKNTSTKNASSPCNTETNLKSSDKQLDSPVTDKQTTSLKKSIVAEKEPETAPTELHSKKTISTDVLLPLVSAVLNITDKIEQCITEILHKMIG